MAKQPQRRRAAASKPRFTPVSTRARHDGWTPDRQIEFIDALADSGCVEEACAAVGVSRQSAYRLRNRPEAQAFRMAWDNALDVAIRRLSDACYSRALNGEAVPHFYQGQQVGEHRRYDNKLAMFLLRYRDPLRYAASLDQMVYRGEPEYAAIGLSRLRNRILDEAHGVDEDEDGDEGPALWTAEPKAAVRLRQQDEAQARSGEYGGSYERRQRLRELGARLRAEEAAANPPIPPIVVPTIAPVPARAAAAEEEPYQEDWCARRRRETMEEANAARERALAGGDAVSPLSPSANRPPPVTPPGGAVVDPALDDPALGDGLGDQAAGDRAAGRARSARAMSASASASVTAGSKPAARIRSIV